jgi:hypothetical protein
MMIQKILRYAEHLGLDKEELLEMTMLEAMLLIENTKDMWKEVKQIG